MGARTLGKKGIFDKKQQDKIRKQLAIEDEKSKVECEDKKIRLEETKEEIWINPNTMDPLTKEWWEIRKTEILKGRRVRASPVGGGGGDAGNGGGSGNLV
jgi:hypothetical protein